MVNHSHQSPAAPTTFANHRHPLARISASNQEQARSLQGNRRNMVRTWSLNKHGDHAGFIHHTRLARRARTRAQDTMNYANEFQALHG